MNIIIIQSSLTTSYQRVTDSIQSISYKQFKLKPTLTLNSGSGVKFQLWIRSSGSDVFSPLEYEKQKTNGTFQTSIQEKTINELDVNNIGKVNFNLNDQVKEIRVYAKIESGSGTTLDNLESIPSIKDGKSGDSIQVNIGIVDNSNNLEAEVINNADEDVDLNGKNGLVTSSIIYGRNNGEIKPILIDKNSRALTTIDIDHHKAHEAKRWFISDYTELGSAVILNFLLKVDAGTIRPHLIFEFDFDSDTTLEVFKNTTVSVDGALQTSVNRDLASANTSVLSVYTAPTITTDGTRIHNHRKGEVGVGVGKPETPGANGQRGELILEPNKNYLIRVTSNDSNNKINWLLDWYDQQH